LTNAGGLRARRAVLMSFSLENYLWHGTPNSASPGPAEIENDSRGEQQNGISSNLPGRKKSHLTYSGMEFDAKCINRNLNESAITRNPFIFSTGISFCSTDLVQHVPALEKR
jgi:hypothetical protein